MPPLKTCANIQSFLRIKKSISRTHVAWCRNNVVSELPAQCPMSVAWMSSWAAVMVCPDGWNLRSTRLAMVWKENVAILLFLNMPFTFSLVKVIKAGFHFEYWDGTTPPEQHEHRWHLYWGRALPGGQVACLQVKAELAHVQVGEDWPQKYENRKNFNLLLLGGPITIVQVRRRLLKIIHNRTGTKTIVKTGQKASPSHSS